ncbi:MAG: carboxypeptidase-like regulatory domain-containing protein, partial [Bacteroidota bacterium]|nr:carboxypeptidase-like regulatory domain-containing protein [Bacteroidota bacterium]
MKAFGIGLLLVVFPIILWGQEYTQTVRGTIVDADTRKPLIGAVVALCQGDDCEYTIMADEFSSFRMEDIPVGRYDVRAQSIGYNDYFLANLEVTSGKEIVLQIELTQSFQDRDTIVITAGERKDRPNNDMTSVSARLFTVEETQRYAGSVGDPARMASNFAGVSSSSDARNDIIIRGNSPSGLLWRLEGIDIPSPNHFSAQGTTGGPVSILNNNLLRNSDFLTGAWPAEYGNSLSGVFDLKMRSGNNEKYEYTAQIGFNGMEAMAEGPFFMKKRGSFLIAYRYSVLELIEMMGFNLGAGGRPRYQDLSFKFVLPNPKFGQIELFGVGGRSRIEILDSKRDTGDFSYGLLQNRDVRYMSRMGVVGLSHVRLLSSSAYIRTILSISYDGFGIDLDSLNPVRRPLDLYNEDAGYIRQTLHSIYSWKPNANNTFKTGLIFTRLSYKNIQEYFLGEQQKWLTLSNAKGSTYLAQPYIQWRHSFSPKLTLNAGLHGQYFFFNKTRSLEPRAGIRYALNTRQSLSFGYGLHGQIQALPLYFFEKATMDSATQVPVAYTRTNKDLGMSNSHHFIAGYDHL